MGVGEQYDVVFECIGVEVCVQVVIYLVVLSGRLMIIGMGQFVQMIFLLVVVLWEVDIVGVFCYVNMYLYGLDVFLKCKEVGLLDIFMLVMQWFSGFDGVFDVFIVVVKLVDENGNFVIKVIIEIQIDDLRVIIQCYWIISFEMVVNIYEDRNLYIVF